MGMLPRSRGQGKTKNQEGYGRGEAHIASGDDVLLDEEAMVAQLLECLEAPDYRPPSLPSIAMELMGLSRRPEVEYSEVVALLEQDAMMAGRILKLAQSPVYAGASRIESLNDALVRLGLRTLRDLVMEIALNLKVFRSPAYADTMDLLRRHSTTTAHLAKLVSRHASVGGDYAFMAGLLHDVGIAGTLLALAERSGARKAPPELLAIWPAVDAVHQRAAELMAAHWELDAEIATALGAHHQVVLKGDPHPLAAALCLADELAHELGFGVIPKGDDAETSESSLEEDCVRSHTNVDRSSPKTLERARAALGVDESGFEALRAEAAELVATLET